MDVTVSSYLRPFPSLESAHQLRSSTEYRLARFYIIIHHLAPPINLHLSPPFGTSGAFGSMAVTARLFIAWVHTRMHKPCN